MDAILHTDTHLLAPDPSCEECRRAALRPRGRGSKQRGRTWKANFRIDTETNAIISNQSYAMGVSRSAVLRLALRYYDAKVRELEEGK